MYIIVCLHRYNGPCITGWTSDKMTAHENDTVADQANDSSSLYHLTTTDPSSSSSAAAAIPTIALDDDDEFDNDYDDHGMNMNQSSFEEQCGFVSHVAIVLLSIYYTTWILSIYSSAIPSIRIVSITDGKHPSFLLLSSQQQQPLKIPLWTIVLPVTLIVLFFLVPIVYGAVINRSAVVVVTVRPPVGHPQVLSILHDKHTIRPLYVSPFVLNDRGNEDDRFDPRQYYYYYCYFRDPMAWRRSTEKTSFDHRPSSQNDHPGSSTTIPDICDVDVADINDLVQYELHMRHSPNETAPKYAYEIK